LYKGKIAEASDTYPACKQHYNTSSYHYINLALETLDYFKLNKYISSAAAAVQQQQCSSSSWGDTY